MGPPICRFTNSLALTKQFKHVEAAVREAGKVSQKKKKKGKRNLSYKVEQFPNYFCESGDMLFGKVCHLSVSWKRVDASKDPL